MTGVVAVFGGSFNPPHLGHQMVCLVALETVADRVLMVPAYRHAFDKPLVEFSHRVEMCRRAAELFGERVEVSEVERTLAEQGESVSRTLHTLRRIAADRPGAELRLVIGADILAETHKWYRWDEVSRLAPPLCVGRVGHGGGGELEVPNISSTDIRARLRRGDSIEGLVSRSVIDYIAEHQLFVRDAAAT